MVCRCSQSRVRDREWADEFLTPRVERRDDRDALDHVAVPQGAPDDDTGMTKRRFVHRSLHEHLVAEHIALRMTAGHAAAELLKHLWYDPDWEYAGPAALAMHPQRIQVLKELIGHLTGEYPSGADLAAVDGCWEIRRFLARVAQESSEDSWTPDAAEMIGQARLDVAVTMPRRDSFPRLAVAGDWPTSNRMIIQRLLAQLAGESDPGVAGNLADAVAGLGPDAEDRARATRTLLTLLVSRPGTSAAWELADAATRLAVTAKERAQARRTLLAQLTCENDPDAACNLTYAFAALDPNAQEQAQARRALLTLLADHTDPGPALRLGWAVTGLDPDGQDRAQARQVLLTLLARESSAMHAASLVDAVAGLTTTAVERAQVRQDLRGLLATKSVSWRPCRRRIHGYCLWRARLPRSRWRRGSGRRPGAHFSNCSSARVAPVRPAIWRMRSPGSARTRRSGRG